MGKSLSGKSAKGRQHVANQKKYSKQWGRTAKNKKKAWSLHLKKNPLDVMARKCIEVAKEKLPTMGRGA